MLKLRKTLASIRSVAQNRHKWTADEKRKLLDKYQEWTEQAGPDRLFSLKDFIMSIRDELPGLQQFDQQGYYERVKRTLYRTLAQSGTAWRHHGKTRLEKQVTDPTIIQILNELHNHGVAIATDGAVLLIFPVEYYTHQPDEGYFVPTIGHAILHLKKMINNVGERHPPLVEEARQVIPLLRRFVEAWRLLPNREEVFDPNVKNKLEADEYEINQNSQNPSEYELVKPDGTRYYCDVEQHTCTCPAGERETLCKHLQYLLFK